MNTVQRVVTPVDKSLKFILTASAYRTYQSFRRAKRASAIQCDYRKLEPCTSVLPNTCARERNMTDTEDEGEKRSGNMEKSRSCLYHYTGVATPRIVVAGVATPRIVVVGVATPRIVVDKLPNEPNQHLLTIHYPNGGCRYKF